MTLNQPFLSTREFFRLKSDAARRKDFLAADQQGRRKLLDQMAGMPRLKASDLHWEGPLEIDRIEWRAGAADLCRLLGWLAVNGGKTAMTIMAVDPGRATPAERFAYVGYKGGAESGVLSMSWLLHTSDSRCIAMAVIWNNKAGEVDPGELVSLMSAAGGMLTEPLATKSESLTPAVNSP